MPTRSRTLQRLFKLAMTCLCFGLGAGLSAGALSACLQVDVRFEVRPDGSGRVVETWRVRGDTPPGLQRPLLVALQPRQLDDRAQAMGQGVKAHTESLPTSDDKDGQAHRVVFQVPDFDGLRWRPQAPPAGSSLDVSFGVSRPPGHAASLMMRNDPRVLAACASVQAREQLLSDTEGLDVDMSVRALGSAPADSAPLILLRLRGGTGPTSAFDAACQPGLTLELR